MATAPKLGIVQGQADALKPALAHCRNAARDPRLPRLDLRELMVEVLFAVMRVVAPTIIFPPR